MKRIGFMIVLLGLLLSVASAGDFKVMEWYSGWDENTYGGGGYAIPPWMIDWTGVGVIVHFDNDNIPDDTPPYWGMIAKGDATVEPTYFEWGQNYPSTANNYIDSLTNIGHRYGAAVVISINEPTPTKLNNLIGDSSKIETMCQAIAQWCQKRHYDGVDLNYETSHSTRANVVRLLRILRRNLNTYVTTFKGNLSRPWLSICSPYQWAGNDASCYCPSDTVYVDMFELQQGTVEWDVPDGRAWYDLAYQIESGGEGYAWAQANNVLLEALSNNASWNSAPNGIRSSVAAGFPKSKIAPAFGIGGADMKIGTDTAMGVYTGHDADLKRCDVKTMLSHGGRKYFDPHYKATSVRGTATATLGWPTAINSGQKFFICAADSIDGYLSTTWLITNGYGGIAPYSVSFDAETSVPSNAAFSEWWKRLPGQSGIFQAKKKLSGTTPITPSDTTPIVIPPVTPPIVPPVTGDTAKAWNDGYISGYVAGAASVKPIIVYDSILVPTKWDNVTYSYAGSATYPDSAVVIPKASVLFTLTHNATTKKTTVTTLIPKTGN